ncbi:hypothetical protein [Demequina activiva]|uniref:Uncharacterized protein n=1 Tax=Demequina activiva TaxID=1582364 RepID=A0A919Q314_9MICO|nr:hypothetical protein [Demequina activiva]GIG53961.1 hypothetical protein Dac01nite_07130 [Demequina activiva]
MSAGEPPERDSSAPTTQQLAVASRLPLSLRLIGRNSAPGALIVAAIALFFVVAVPALAGVLRDPEPAADDAVAAGGTLELSLAEGWSVESQSSGVTTVVSGSATLTVRASISGPASLEPLVDEAVAALAEDPTANWVITDPVPYTTESGYPGFTVSATSETLSTQTWVIDNGTLDTVSTLAAPLESWAGALPGAQEIVESMAVAPSPQSSTTSEPGLP